MADGAERKRWKGNGVQDREGAMQGLANRGIDGRKQKHHLHITLKQDRIQIMLTRIPVNALNPDHNTA